MSSGAPTGPREVTPDDVDRFWTEGFVVVRRVLDGTVLHRLRDAVDRVGQTETSTDMSAMAAGLTRESPNASSGALPGRPLRGSFIAGVDHWQHDADLDWFARESPLPGLVATILGSDAVWLYEDSVLVKEPNTAERTHWHQDASYFQIAGNHICTTWCPLDPVSPESGALVYAVGSHLSGQVYRPNLFVSREPLPGTAGDIVPDEPTGPTRTVALEPGDVVVHHARTLHSAGGNVTERPRRAVSVRYCGDDARYHLRPGVPLKPHHRLVRDGDALGGPGCPRVWPRD